MSDYVPHLKLTHEGALKMLRAAVAKATEMKQPQCISITDDGGHLLAFVRMDGAKVLSIDSSLKKAMTAASSRVPTGKVHAEVEAKLALATSGKLTNLLGGAPIVVEGHVIGAIGVGSGTGEQDLEVAKAAIAALPGAQRW
ncbi:MAG TPA: heme-binding protein [Burkholderiales bacterium]|nr:heme-binding protein [Burkholderiales bacterium]